MWPAHNRKSSSDFGFSMILFHIVMKHGFSNVEHFLDAKSLRGTDTFRFVIVIKVSQVEFDLNGFIVSIRFQQTKENVKISVEKNILRWNEEFNSKQNEMKVE